jgi:Domain of unknown function (DUF4406)
MNIYLAGPMRGHPELNHPAFHLWAGRLREAGHVVFNPAEHSPTDPAVAKRQIRALMLTDLNWVLDVADAVVLLPGWETSLGATAEQATAHAIGIPVFLVAKFLGVPE